MTSTPSHPKALYVLFFTEMWERFGFFTLRSTLVLYMTGKLLMSEESSFALFGAFASFLYLSPLAGGYLADKALGRKWAVILGGIFLCAGYLTLVSDTRSALYVGLGSVILGNGLFKPNISGMLGHLYPHGDARRESGFSLFYSGVNLGAFLAALMAGSVVALLGWDALFALASCGCGISLTIFLWRQPWRESHLHDAHGKTPSPLVIAVSMAGSVLGVAAFSLLLLTPRLAELLVLAAGAFTIAYIMRLSFKLPPSARNKILGCHILILYAALLWGLGQQAAMSLTMFAEINTQRTVLGYTLSAEVFQAVNPLTIILAGPLLFRLWPMLEARGRTPGLPMKFALGGMLMAASCFFIPLGVYLAAGDGRSNAVWLSLCYILQGIGEVIVAPAGLAMIVELVPRKMTSLMYGMWLYSMALGNLLADLLSELTTVPGAESVANTNPLFSVFFSKMGIAALVVSAVMILCAPSLDRLMGAQKQTVSK